MYWPYENIDCAEFEAAIKLAEHIIQNLGAVYIEEHTDNEIWMTSKVQQISEQMKKKVFKFRNEYVRVDKVYFSEEPYIVLEFGNKVSGPYEDADPFPFNIERNAFEREIRCSMGIDPYPEWQDRAIKENWMPAYANLMAVGENYAIYHAWEEAVIVDIRSKEKYSMKDYYGDPEIALIDKDEKFAVVVGLDGIGIFDIENKQLEHRKIHIPEWIYSINQEGRKIQVICEKGKIYTFDI